MPQSICSAVLIDVAGKQDYIFSSNKLKENIGASFIIAYQLFGETLRKSIMKICNCSEEESESLLIHWESLPNTPFSLGLKVEIGYIGGGNALILFNDNKLPKKFIQYYSEQVLRNFPGIQIAFGLSNSFDRNDLKESTIKLKKSLNTNRSLYFTNYQAFKHGIASDCPLSGEGQECYDKDLKAWVSKQSFRRIEENKSANTFFDNKYNDILENDFGFTSEIEQLNAKEEKTYVAVVHIDGNGMGQQFAGINCLTKLRKRSVEVTKKLDASLKKLLEYVSALSREQLGQGDKAYLRFHKEKGKYILPFRSIINAGDDITFVCHGDLGVHLAEKYVGFLADPNIGGISISSCAGVAVVNIKYPFYRAYKLAEELTGAAKMESRNYRKEDASDTSNNSWINFHISSGGYTGDFEDLINRKYKSLDQVMKHGPFRLLEEQDGDRFIAFNTVKQKILTMLYSVEPNDRWPKNKLLELRSMLTENTTQQDYFQLEMEARQLDFKTSELVEFPFYDMIDLIDFYPEQLLQS